MSRRLRVLLATSVALCVIAAATHAIWLSWIGHALVKAGQPRPAGAVVVLGGDYKGERILHAAGLAQRGLAPRVLVSGAVKLYGVNEADLAINFAVKQGLPRTLFEAVYLDATSTEGECSGLRGQLDSRGIRGVLIVTSNFHTARAARICRKHLGADIEMTMVAAPDRYFSPDGWWRHREGQKTVFFEYAKTIANWLGH